MQTHRLKTWPNFFEAIGRGDKPFEVRKNDRGFAEGDRLLLHEWFPEQRRESGRWIACTVSYVLHGGQFGIEPGHVVMGIRLPDNHQWPIVDTDNMILTHSGADDQRQLDYEREQSTPNDQSANAGKTGEAE